MKRFCAMFVLTPGEQRIVIWLVLGLLAWNWLKHEQKAKRETSISFSSASPGEE